MEGEKGLAYPLLKGLGKVSGWDLAFAQRVRGWQEKLVLVVWFVIIVGGGSVVCGLHRRWGGKKVYGGA